MSAIPEDEMFEDMYSSKKSHPWLKALSVVALLIVVSVLIYLAF